MTFISVDVETTGTVPGKHAVIQIGAVNLGNRKAFDRMIYPFPGAAIEPEAMMVNRIDLKKFDVEPVEFGAVGFTLFNEWARIQGPEPIFIGWNAAFDWAFITEGFGRYGLKNPFAHRPIDIISMAAGWMGCLKVDRAALRARLDLAQKKAVHDALEDAVDQGEVFSALMAKMAT